jgi:hypothetical protein
MMHAENKLSTEKLMDSDELNPIPICLSQRPICLNDRLDTIIDLFKELLKVENNAYANCCYKYATHYSSYIRNIDITDYNMEMHLIEFVRIIKYEEGTCRGHNYNEGPFEDKILNNIKSILIPMLPAKHNEYMRILDHERTIKYEIVVDVNTFGVQLAIDFSGDTKNYEITNNLRTIHRLKDANGISENIEEIKKLFAYYNCIRNFAI